MIGISAGAIAQLSMDPPHAYRIATWVLTLVVIALALVSLLPWRGLPESVRIGLVVASVVAGGILLPMSQAGASVAFVFIASATAGERLASRRVAFTVAGIGTVVAAVSAWLLFPTSTVSNQLGWWLPLTVGLPVFIGTSHRDRIAALAAAEYAAVQGERVAKSEAREAAFEERGRIAREIHDVLGHSLSGIAMQLDMADALHHSGRDAQANEAVRHARGLAVSGIAETRRAIQALREDTLPLPETLRHLADSSHAQLTITGEPGTVSVESAQAIIRAAQEAVTNAQKYAPGGEVRVNLEYHEALLRLTVSDSGPTKPASAARAQGSGMGLVGMRERAALLGGTLHVGPTNGAAAGWTVVVELPR